MKNFTDEYLRSILKEKLEKYEADPDDAGWERLQNHLPRVSSFPKRSGVIVTGAMLILVSGLIGYFFRRSSHETVSNITVVRKQDSLVTRRDSDGKMNLPGSYEKRTSPDEPMQKSNDTSLRISSRKRMSKLVSDVPVLIPSSQKADEPGLSILNVHETNRAKADSRYTEISANSDTSAIDELIMVKDSVISKPDSTDSKRDTKRLLKNWSIKLTPFYTTAVFTPLQHDNIEIGGFSQSSNLLKNRLGLTLAVGYTHNLINKLDIEYSVGYKVWAKNFKYTITGMNGESFQVSDKSVSGVIHSVQLGVALKSSILTQRYPLIFSLSYEKLLGDDKSTFARYMGSQLLQYGVGLERKLSDRISVLPGVLYSVPLGRKFEHFKMQPVQFNVGFSWKLEKN